MLCFIWHSYVSATVVDERPSLVRMTNRRGTMQQVGIGLLRLPHPEPHGHFKPDTRPQYIHLIYVYIYVYTHYFYLYMYYVCNVCMLCYVMVCNVM